MHSENSAPRAFGAHQRFTNSGSIHASNTLRAGAWNVREMMIRGRLSTPPSSDSFAFPLSTFPVLSAASRRIVERPPFEYSKMTFCVARCQHPGLGEEIVAVVESATPEARAEGTAAFVARTK